MDGYHAKSVSKEGNMAKSILIVGAGIAGLSAGCYGQMDR